MFVSERQDGGTGGRSTSLASGNIALVATFSGGRAGIYVLALP